jgi:glucose/arabinose dehydrogenase
MLRARLRIARCPPTLCVLALAAACGGGTSTPSASPQPPSVSPHAATRTVALQVVARGLESPADVAGVPGTDSLAVVEKTGRVLLLRGGRVTGTLLDLRGQVSQGTEQGLLSIAFDPEYTTNHLAYVDYTDPGGGTHIARLDTASGRLRTVLFIRQPFANHNGGGLAFGPDGLLYVGMGDGGSEGDPEGNGQNRSTLLGKIVRLDVQRERPQPQIYAYGLRNPWRISFDTATGELWIADVGQDHWEEIDRLPRGAPPGANLGWNAYEGRAVYRRQTIDRSRLVWPVAVYSHDDGRCSISGGDVYRGTDVPALRGDYVFGDFCSGTIWTLPARGGEPRMLPLPRVEALSSFGEDTQGHLYVVSLNGTLLRFVSG